MKKTSLLVAIAGAGLVFSTASQAYVAGTRVGDLRDGRTQNLALHLEGGVRYVIGGACDDDCTDLDLEVRNSNGRLLVRDIAPDDTPVVVFTPSNAGDYTLRVIMADCTANPCAYRIVALAE